MKHLLCICLSLLLCGTAIGEQIPASKLSHIYCTADGMAAAKELSTYLQRITGKEFPVERVSSVQGPGFYVGGKLAPAKRPDSDHPEAFFQVITPEGRIHLWGKTNTKRIPGDFRAVEEFLQRTCGVRWLWPGPLGEVVPKNQDLKFETASITDKPVFTIRTLKYGLPPDWYRRMKLGQSIDFHPGHSFSKWFPPKEYFKSHPEYYGLVSSVNWVGAGNKPSQPTRVPLQLCTSNPEVRRILAEKVAASNADAPLSISPNDGYGFCECAECRKLDQDPWTSIHTFPNLSHRMYDFVREVAQLAKQKNPKSKVILNAYTFCKNPPKNIAPMPDNVYVNECFFGITQPDWKESERKFDTYRKLGVKLSVYEYWGTYNQGLPWNLTHMIGWECKMLAQLQGIGIRTENNSDFANSGLNNYVGAKLLWNPYQDVDAIIDDYCRAAFGNAAPIMKKYYALVEEKTRQLPLLAGGGYAAMLSMIPQVYTPEFFASAKELFRQANAKNLKLTEEEKARVKFVGTGLAYGEMTAQWAAALRKINAYCGNLPLVWVEDQEPSLLNDAELTSIYQDAIKKCNRKATEAYNHKDDWSLQYSELKRIEGTWWLMPRTMLIQKGATLLRNGNFNYFVNNAFELRTNPAVSRKEGCDIFGWRYSGASAALDLSTCRDDESDITAMCHGKQGISLRLEIPANGKGELKNASPVQSQKGQEWSVSGYFKDTEPEVWAIWELDGKVTREKLVVGAKGIIEKSGWRQIEWNRIAAPAENAKLSISFEFPNATQAKKTVFCDHLKLRKSR